MKCKCCNGSGDMPNKIARYIYDETGERPNQRFGCTSCDGIGEVKEDD